MSTGAEVTTFVSSIQIRARLPCSAVPGTLTCDEVRSHFGEFSTAQNPPEDLITPAGRYFARICVECSALCEVVAHLPLDSFK